MSMGKPKAPGETAAQRTQADVGIESYQMSRKLAPVKDDLYKRISDFRQEKQQLKDRSHVDTTVAYRGSGETVAAGRPAQPGAVASLGLRRAGSVAQQAAQTHVEGEQASVAGRQGLVGMALGDRSEAIQGVDELARNSASTAIERARNDAASYRNTVNTLGSTVGAGLSLYQGLPKRTTADQYAIGGPNGPTLTP